MNNELYHHGILGQKWGVRRFQNPDGSLTEDGKRRYRSTSIRSYIARKRNEKVDKSFKQWNENSKKRADAIELGKERNRFEREYQNNKTHENRDAYRKANSEYKKAFRENTTYRKGQIKSEVEKDKSRKYLSEAKQIEKKLKTDPNNRDLQKQYQKLMNQHDIAREKGRRAPEAYANRSKAIANVKRAGTIAVKSAIATAAVSIGAYAVNKYLNDHEVRFNGERVNISTTNIRDIADMAKKIEDFMKYF